jgi:hypothetical protein
VDKRKGKEMRESGYYWVKVDKGSKWESAEYSREDYLWFITGSPIGYHNDYFFEISETRIKSPEEL